MRFYFPAFILGFIVLVAAYSAQAVWEYPPAAKKHSMSKKADEIAEDASAEIEDGMARVYDYCLQLPESQRPMKGCSCVAEQYKQYNNSKHASLKKFLGYYQTSLETTEDKIMERSKEDNSLMFRVSAFCESYFNDKNLDVIPDKFSRDLVRFKPVFDNKKDEEAYQQELIELRQRSRSASSGYCTALHNINIIEHFLSRDMLGDKDIEEAYKISTSGCGGTANPLQ